MPWCLHYAPEHLYVRFERTLRIAVETLAHHKISDMLTDQVRLASCLWSRSRPSRRLRSSSSSNADAKWTARWPRASGMVSTAPTCRCSTTHHGALSTRRHNTALGVKRTCLTSSDSNAPNLREIIASKRVSGRHKDPIDLHLLESFRAESEKRHAPILRSAADIAGDSTGRP